MGGDWYCIGRLLLLFLKKGETGRKGPLYLPIDMVRFVAQGGFDWVSASMDNRLIGLFL